LEPPPSFRVVRQAEKTPIAFAIALALLSLATFARASDVNGPDGIYGRLRSDTALSIEAGGGVGIVRGSDPRPALSGTLRARALEMAGLFIGYDATFGATRADAAVVGVDLRPLFFARVFSNWEAGPRWLDLMVDSIGLDLGLGLTNPGATWGAGSGLAYVLGAGIEFPIVWNQGNALLARVSIRWTHAASWDAEGNGGSDMALINLSLVGRTIVRVGLVGVR
jgi:hypothetical protein